MESVSKLIRDQKGTAFSFEILPPLKGSSIEQAYKTIDRLKEFDPKYINITSHHSESISKTRPDGSLEKIQLRKRPGSVAIASAIQTRYSIPAIPHIICKGFTKEETEYALIDLQYLGINNLLLLRGDAKGLDASHNGPQYHNYATELQHQINDFNNGIALDGSNFDAPTAMFRYGMACYPEKHEEAPSMESDIRYAKQKVDAGAEYLVTQMFFDNAKYFEFVDRCMAEGINVPIIPGIKPVVFRSQLTVLPKVFCSSIPEPFATELQKCKTDDEAKQVGIDWCITQCRELIKAGVPSLHFYTFLATDSVYRVAKEIY